VQGPRDRSGTLTTSAGSVRYRHDEQGRVVRRQRPQDSGEPATWCYQWDADDRLTAVTVPDGSMWRYRYDPLGRRIAKQRLGPSGELAEETAFAWDGAVLAEETSCEAGRRHRMTWDYRPGTFTPLAQCESLSLDDAPQDDAGERFYAIITDQVGMPAELVAADGTVAGYQQHTLWGATVWYPGGASTPLRFPGQYEDPETGLHYNHHRYYDPATGRYLSPDPLGLVPAPNPHAYVLNPCVLADPLGLDPAAAAGGKSVFMAPDDVVGQNAMKATLEPGYHDVIVHGNPTGFGISGWNATPEDLAQLLRQDSGYAGGPIRLISCNTGSQWGGAAQQLADELGVEVKAPTYEVWTRPDGSLTIGPSQFSRSGRWISFSPVGPAAPTSLGNEVLNDSVPQLPPPSFGRG
jgi:RHS repeat-associated protein